MIFQRGDLMRKSWIVWLCVGALFVTLVVLNLFAPRHKLMEPKVRARHILIRGDFTKGEDDPALQKIQEIKRRIDNGEGFSKLAREFSEDETTARIGGDLGYFGPREMDAAFEEVAFTLKEGQVSDVVRTGHGYHLILVVDRIDPETP